jgi:predicted DNA-binding protein
VVSLAWRALPAAAAGVASLRLTIRKTRIECEETLSWFFLHGLLLVFPSRLVFAVYASSLQQHQSRVFRQAVKEKLVEGFLVLERKPAMSNLPFGTTSPDIEGDENKYLWSTRIPEGVHQRLLDMASERNLNKAALLRDIIFLVVEHWPKIAEHYDIEFSSILETDIQSEAAKRRQDKRKAAHKDVMDLLTRAASEDYQPLKAELVTTAKRKAEAHRIPFPPPDLPLDVTNQDAAYVLKWVKRVMTESKTSRVRLNELNPRIRQFKADKLREIIAQLEEHGYVTTNEETTSGPSTLWISLPSYEYVIELLQTLNCCIHVYRLGYVKRIILILDKDSMLSIVQ